MTGVSSWAPRSRPRRWPPGSAWWMRSARCVGRLGLGLGDDPADPGPDPRCSFSIVCRGRISKRAGIFSGRAAAIHREKRSLSGSGLAGLFSTLEALFDAISGQLRAASRRRVDFGAWVECCHCRRATEVSALVARCAFVAWAWETRQATRARGRVASTA